MRGKMRVVYAIGCVLMFQEAIFLWKKGVLEGVERPTREECSRGLRRRGAGGWSDHWCRTVT
jgi:hypothetical protein